jgi:hypothetical protein
MNTIEVLGKLHDFISQPVLFVVFGLMCVVFGISSFVLLFHWDRYAVDNSMVASARAVYFLGGALILMIGFVSIILF